MQPTTQTKCVTKITMSCGCGFNAKTLREAQMHAEQMRHVITLHGQMGPVERLSGARVVSK